MESEPDLVNAELDADESQDEILAKAGVYDIPFDRPVLSKILVVIGVVILAFGLLFWYQINGLMWPSLSPLGPALMPLLAIFLSALGLGCLLAGIGFAIAYRHDPYDMKPIR